MGSYMLRDFRLKLRDDESTCGGGTKASNLVFRRLSFVFAENDPQAFRCVV